MNAEEIDKTMLSDVPPHYLQWGLSMNAEEMYLGRARKGFVGSLQWGLSMNAEEMVHRAVDRVVRLLPSMGPQHER